MYVYLMQRKQYHYIETPQSFVYNKSTRTVITVIEKL